MQLNKSSKKTAKAAEQTVVAAEKNAAPEPVTKPRSSKSSKPNKTELTEMASGTHHHKVAPAPEPAPAKSLISQSPAPQAEAKPLVDTPSHVISPNRIAELAYSYWLERGCIEGSSEEDWLRAEKALAAGA